MSKEQPSEPPPPYTGFKQDAGFNQPQHPPYSNFNTGAPSGYANSNQPPYMTQPYGVQQGAYGNASTIVVSQPSVSVIQTFREVPVRMRCPHCSADVVTAIEYETGTFAWVICMLLFVFGCFLFCCLLPFCVDGCKDVVHKCPNCHQQIGRFSRM
uniref:LITAF domain-containing protein n=1 Tax=Arion vulgaris TaxID=1028688 RepID=A0A0B6ZZV9_9EUPU